VLSGVKGQLRVVGVVCESVVGVRMCVVSVCKHVVGVCMHVVGVRVVGVSMPKVFWWVSYIVLRLYVHTSYATVIIFFFSLCSYI
jgi:hypothetical protein